MREQSFITRGGVLVFQLERAKGPYPPPLPYKRGVESFLKKWVIFFSLKLTSFFKISHVFHCVPVFLQHAIPKSPPTAFHNNQLLPKTVFRFVRSCVVHASQFMYVIRDSAIAQARIRMCDACESLLVVIKMDGAHKYIWMETPDMVQACFDSYRYVHVHVHMETWLKYCTLVLPD